LTSATKNGNILMWEKYLKCKFCHIMFHINEFDVIWADLRDPIYFVPDYQYYVECPQCKAKLVQGDIPSDIAIGIQERNANNTLKQNLAD
jgi:hypothetical protein